MRYAFAYRINGVTVQEFKSQWIGELLDKFRTRIAATKYQPANAMHEFEVRDLDANVLIAYYKKEETADAS